MIYGLLLGNLLMVLTIILRFNHLPPQIPLFYSKLQGEDQLADTWMIAILPFLMNLLIIINSYISHRFFKDTILVKKVFDYLNYAVIISFTIIFMKIIFLVT